MDVTRKPVEFGDNQHGLVFPARIEGGVKFRAVVSTSALDLGKALNYEFPMSMQEDINGLLLGFQPQPF